MIWGEILYFRTPPKSILFSPLPFHQVNAHWGDVKLEDVLDPEPRAVAAFFWTAGGHPSPERSASDCQRSSAFYDPKATFFSKCHIIIEYTIYFVYIYIFFTCMYQHMYTTCMYIYICIYLEAQITFASFTCFRHTFFVEAQQRT